jgi:hypothetical protein
MPSDPKVRFALQAASFVYAALLVATVARLEGGPSVSRSLLSLSIRPFAASALSPRQSLPRGWPLWTSVADDRAVR